MMSDNPAGDTDRNGSGLGSRLMRLFNRADHDEESILQPDDQSVELQSVPMGRREMIERVVAFDQKQVVDVMAPRADIASVDIETPLPELIRLFAAAGHSRMPVYRGDLDDPVGMVHIKDVVGLIADDPKKSDDATLVLTKIRRDILYVPPSMRITDLLLRMQASRIHMALVIDEYGGTDGLVTIEDLVEEIVGDINDEHDVDDSPLIASVAGGGWDVDARVELEEFSEETGIIFDIEDEEIDTVGGYVVSLAGRVPQRNEILVSPQGYDLEVLDADARKVRRLRIKSSVANPSEAAE